MSVILDALRRARASAGARRPAAASRPGIPAGLRVGGTPAAPAGGAPRGRKRTANAGGTRWGLVAGVVVAGAAVYAGVQFLPLFLSQESGLQVVNTTPPGAASGTVPVAQTPSLPESIPELVERIQEPPVAAPRAMPGAREAAEEPAGPPPAETASAGPPEPAARPAPAPRPPVPAAEPPAAAAAVTAVTPTPPVNHFDLAIRYHSLGNFEQALTHYNAVLVADEFNIEARNNLGMLYYDRGLTTEAIEQLQRAIRIDPQYVRARSNLAVIFMNTGRLAEARAQLREAMTAQPRNADLLVNLALVEKADLQPERAKDLLNRAVGLSPGHAAAHYNLAVLHDDSGDTSRALAHYTRFLEYAGPDHGERLSDVQRRIDTINTRLLPSDR